MFRITGAYIERVLYMCYKDEKNKLLQEKLEKTFEELKVPEFIQRYFIRLDSPVSKLNYKVLVSGNKQLQVIDEVITPEEAIQRFDKNITAEVICKVDTSSYDIRVEDRKRAADVKKKMDAMIKKMDETNKYEMYAERNPELKELLEAYKELVG